MLNINIVLFRRERVLVLVTPRHAVSVFRAVKPDADGYIEFAIYLDGEWAGTIASPDAAYATRRAYYEAHWHLRYAESKDT